MRQPNAKQQVREAIEAVREKKGEDVAVLQMDKASSAFTDYFVVASGSNPRQIQAISDEVEERLSKAGLRPTHVEGYNQAEWVLLDYVDFVVHVFSESARKFYDLERLWKSATRLNPQDLRPLEKKAVARPAAARRSPASRTTPSRRTTAAKTPRRAGRPKKRTGKK